MLGVTCTGTSPPLQGSLDPPLSEVAVWGKYIDPALVGLQVRVLHLTRVLTAPSPYHGVIGSLVGVLVSGVLVSGVLVSGVLVSVSWFRCRLAA